MEIEKNKEFDDLYRKYHEEVEALSAGLVETSKTDFLKMCSFYNSIVYPDINKQMSKLYELIVKVK